MIPEPLIAITFEPVTTLVQVRKLDPKYKGPDAGAVCRAINASILVKVAEPAEFAIRTEYEQCHVPTGNSK